EDAGEPELSFLRLYDEPDIVRRQLVQLSTMTCAGDLLVFGAYDGSMVVNFEDHGGAHGGLGGVQMFPFMAAPSSLGIQFDSITDATELHPIFVGRYQSGLKTEQVLADESTRSTGPASAVGE